MIHEHLKKESPFSRTVMITHANDRVGNMPDDAAFDQVSSETTTSRLKRGCAANTIFNSFLQLMEQR